MWAQIINVLIGIWLMASPSILNYNDSAADSNHIVAPIIATIATVACWEATRGIGKLNILFGVWMLVAPLIIGYINPYHIINNMACGSVVILLATMRGKIKGHYGEGWNIFKR